MSYRVGLPVMFVSLVCASTALALVERPVTVGYAVRTQSPPQIDGVLDDACWAACEPLTDYARDNVDELDPRKTIARICYDESFLYFAFECEEEDIANMRLNNSGWALPWADDSIEIFLKPDPQGKYFQYGANVRGANNIKAPQDQSDMVMAKGTQGENAYYIEARIPWKNFGLEGPCVGKGLALNMTRNRYRESGKINSSWSRIKGSFHQFTDFGVLMIEEAFPAVQVEKIQLGWKTEGSNVAVATVKNTGDQPQTVQFNLGDSQVKAVIPAGQTRKISCFAELPSGMSSLDVSVVADGQPCFTSTLSVVAMASPTSQKMIDGIGSFRLVTPQPVVFQGQPCTLLAESILLTDENGQTPQVSMRFEAVFPDGTTVSRPGDSLTFDVPSEMEDGDIQLSLTVETPAGEPQTLQSVLPARGKFRQQCLDQLATLEGRLAEFSFPEGTDQANELVYSRWKIDELRQTTESMSDLDVERLRMQIPELSYTFVELKSGKLPVWGLRNSTYFSAVDESMQPYVVTVPPSYEPEGDRTYPLFIFLHGSTTAERWNPQGLLKPLEIACWKRDVISTIPWGRRNQGYRNDGETDIWDVLADIQRRYRIDPDRIYLGGFSMGGGGTMYLSMSAPHRFATIIPCSSGVDMNRLGNIRHLPAWLHCGGQESIFSGMQEAARRIKEQGNEVRFTSDPASGHTTDYIDFDAVVDWMLQYRLEKAPKTISYITNEPRHAEGYWARIDGFAEYGKPARMEISVDGQQIDVKAENVTTLTLTPPQQVIDLTKEFSVVLNGEAVDVSPNAEGQLILTVNPPMVHDGPVKATGKPSGPAGDVWARPFLVAYRSGEEAARKAAEGWCAQWESTHEGKMKARPDTEITEDELKTRGLFLFGSPTEGTPAQRALANLPVSAQADRVSLAGKDVEGSELAWRVLNLNAFAPDQYVLWVAAQRPEDIDAVVQTLNDRRGTDFALFKPNPENPEEKITVWDGWFKADWTTPEEGK